LPSKKTTAATLTIHKDVQGGAGGVAEVVQLKK
jgi:hypothetical protein